MMHNWLCILHFFLIHAVNCKKGLRNKRRKKSRKWDGLMCHWLSGERDMSCPSTLHWPLSSHHHCCLVWGLCSLSELLQEAAEGDALRCRQASAIVYSVNRRESHRPDVLESPRGWRRGCSGGVEGSCWGLRLSEAALREERWSKIWTETMILDRKQSLC